MSELPINVEAMTDFLVGLLNTPSPTGYHLEAIDYVEKAFAAIRGLKLSIIWGWFPTMMWNRFVLSNDSTVREEADNSEHEQILNALARHDSAAAERLMRYHIDQARQALVEHLDEI